MTSFLATIIGDKKGWKAMEARAGRLPRDHRVVHGEMNSSMWRVTSGDGMDVAAFCDARLSGALTYLDRWRPTLNRGVAAQLAE